ncbi:MAG: hypothetical protein U5K84_08670 [Alkalibacterium sp.]|nr:hypothetical protein [Alkalibacterium sp.]
MVDLLTTFDEEKAFDLSREVLEKNDERKAIVEKITEEAFLQARKNSPSL